MKKKLLPIVINLLIIACITLICVAPILSTALAGNIASSAGCELDEGSVHPCLINGQDYGEVLYSLGMMAWYTFMSVPLGIGLFLVYLLVILIIFLVRRSRRDRSSPAES